MTNLDLARLKKFALAFAIIIVMNLFFNTGIAVFNPSAEYSAFCPDEIWEDQAICEEYGGEWVVEGFEHDPEWGYCADDGNCWERVQEANQVVERLNFIILAGAGVLCLILGIAVVMPSAVANGLMYGGVISILIGWARAAQYLDNLAHFVISGVFLLLLIVLGFKKLKD